MTDVDTMKRGWLDDCGLLFETMADISILNGNPFAWYVNLT